MKDSVTLKSGRKITTPALDPYQAVHRYNIQPPFELNEKQELALLVMHRWSEWAGMAFLEMPPR
jgi:hypothetical protein